MVIVVRMPFLALSNQTLKPSISMMMKFVTGFVALLPSRDEALTIWNFALASLRLSGMALPAKAPLLMALKMAL